MNSPNRNQGKILIVTGASRGIGEATAVLAAKQGWQVLINYVRDKKAAERVVQTIQSLGGIAASYQADVSIEHEVVGMFEECRQRFGAVSGLVNNAGTLEQQMPLVEMDAARIDRVFAVNFRGSFLCAREAVKQMSKNRNFEGGSIVNVSSAASRLGSAGEYIDYAASKGAIDTMTIGLANEVASQGIRVNAVRPGFIDTGIHAKGGEPGRLDRVRKNIPLGRSGTSEEIAESIVWLLSDKSSYCTGMFIDCAGGR